MTSKPPLLSGEEIIKAFKRIGYYKVHQRGSHVKIRNDSKGITLTIPNYKEIDRWLLQGIIEDAGLEVDEFKKLI